MIKIYDEFRQLMDSVIHKCMHKRIVIYGYDYSGRFVAWYAEYYHNLKPDYIITEDYTNIIPYEYPLFRWSLFDFNYKDVENTVVWVCTAITDEIKERLEKHGYVKDETYFDFNEAVYGLNYDKERAFTNVQFNRYLENKGLGDWIEPYASPDIVYTYDSATPTVNINPKELFPALDKCHCHPSATDAIFDFGCGKGGAMLSFLDYGFNRVGGVEFVDVVYDILENNFNKLELEKEGKYVECIRGDARNVKKELDDYNWFYFYNPFGREIIETVLENICASLKRKKRKIYIMYFLPFFHKSLENTGMFELTSQFEIMSRQRVATLWVSK